MKIRRFEEMKVWQDSREFTNSVYKLTAIALFKRDFGLKDQIQRASVSVMSNIAEGYERDNARDFVRFLLYSKASMGEARSLLCVASDLSYISAAEYEQMTIDAIAISKQIANFIKYLRRTSAKK